MLAAGVAALAQTNPPVPVPTGPVNPPAATPSSAATPAPPAGPSAPPTPVGSGAPAPAPSGSASPPVGTPEPGTSPEASPAATPTPPPIVVDPAKVGVEPGKVTSARVNSALGTIVATSADPAVATVVADPVQRRIFVTGVALGRTVVTVRDDRGLTRDVPVLVAYAAGTVADETTVRITGAPASADFVRATAIRAATSAATIRRGARAAVYEGDVRAGNVRQNTRADVDVPVELSGEGFFTTTGRTRVHVENDALPPIVATRLLVSDYPERLVANGLLFSADLDPSAAQRFLYYHYNPPTEPARRILLKATNAGTVPATLQMVAGIAGPSTNEMEVGHVSTKTFLVREARNEGTVVTIAGGATVNLVEHDLPPGAIDSGLLELREIGGPPLALALVAQDAAAPTDQSIATTTLLSGGAPHARGAYAVPTFSFDDTYTVGNDPLEVTIGQLPLPNLREGEVLGGDYGVQQRIRVVIVNPTRTPQNVALYANPRGGRATGTFLVDNTVVQAHALPAFSRYKLWQETIGPEAFRTVRITTMPEGGSSYPLRLLFDRDDGSVAPGAPGSPVY